MYITYLSYQYQITSNIFRLISPTLIQALKILVKQMCQCSEEIIEASLDQLQDSPCYQLRQEACSLLVHLGQRGRRRGLEDQRGAWLGVITSGGMVEVMHIISLADIIEVIIFIAELIFHLNETLIKLRALYWLHHRLCTIPS